MEVNGYTIKSGADLRGASLSGANLSVADLSGANLRGADLSGANLSGANLRGTDLRGASLFWANLLRADLFGADLTGANLLRADLFGADLIRADLSGANLIRADLSEAVLGQTVLDPANETNNGGKDFRRRGNFVVGYRTRDKYLDGRTYAAPWFSTCETECHPGLYLWPTLAAAQNWAPATEIIAVHTFARDIHKAGTKYRCRWFRVVGTVEE